MPSAAFSREWLAHCLTLSGLGLASGSGGISLGLRGHKQIIILPLIEDKTVKTKGFLLYGILLRFNRVKLFKATIYIYVPKHEL